MMQDRDAIIVLRDFDSGIDANIAKSKLDANDIPCFLTQENMASLYQHAVLGIRVRLHVFEKDKEGAERILYDIELDDNRETFCPKCNSSSLERDFPRKFSNKFLGLLTVVFFGIFIPQKKIFRCLHCNHEF